MTEMAGADVVYRGFKPESSIGGRLVIVEVGGQIVGPLPHRRKHSPGGLSWGYLGSGAAELARSLLIDVLGEEELRCRSCDGWGCRNRNCDLGYTLQPALYQQFKAEVIAELPLAGWTLSRTQILDWLAGT